MASVLLAHSLLGHCRLMCPLRPLVTEDYRNLCNPSFLRRLEAKVEAEDLAVALEQTGILRQNSLIEAHMRFTAAELFRENLREGLVALTGIEGAWRQFSSVHRSLSCARYVQLVPRCLPESCHKRSDVVTRLSLQQT